MESFTIQCTSCQSRIRVRNPKMIGQIANCPKCGSMIMISAPQQITIESGNVTDSVAVTREALPQPDAQTLENFHNVSLDPGFRSDGLPIPHSYNQSHAEAAGNDLEHGLPPIETPDLNGIPAGAWMPEPTAPPRAGEASRSSEQVATAAAGLRAKRLEAAHKKRQILLVAGIALCSVLLATGALVLFLTLFPAKQPIARKENINPPATGTAPDVVPAGEQPTTPMPTIETGADPAMPTIPDNITTPPSQPQALTTNPPEATPPAPAGEALPRTSVPSTTIPAPAVTPDSTAVSPTPATSSSGAPLNNSIAPSLDSVFAEPGKDPAAAASTTTELPPGLMSFASIFDQSLEPALPDATVPVEKAADLPDDPAEKSNDQAAPGSNLPKDADKRLKTELRGLRIDKRPLSDAIIAIASVAELPIVADLDAMSVAGQVVNPIIDITSTEPVPLGDVIKQLSVQSGFSFDPYDNQALIVRSTNQRISEHVPAQLPIADLVSTADETAALVAAIKSVLPELGESFQAADGKLTISLDAQNQMTWYQVARLLETWRVTRGIANADSATIVPESSRLPTWPKSMEQQLTATRMKNFLPPEAIVRTWQRLCSEAGLTCWVDWYGLKAVDVSPTQSAAVIAQNRPLIELFQHFATKYDIVFAIEDDKSLWITSAAMHRLQPRLYVLPLGDRTLDEWKTELEPLAPMNPATRTNALVIVPTPDGKHLFVRCCRPILAGR